MNIPTSRPIPGVERLRHGEEQCAFKVSSPAGTGGAKFREREFAPRGLDPERCVRIARFAVGGLPLCRQHAAELVLSYSLGEQDDFYRAADLPLDGAPA